MIRVIRAKITETKAISYSKNKQKISQSGGKMPRIRFRKQLFISDKNDIIKYFKSIKRWSIAISTAYALIPTLFSVEPKEHTRKNQDTITKDFTNNKKELDPDVHYIEICPNFDPRSRLLEIIQYYCPDWNILSNPSKSKDWEVYVNVALVKDNISNRGILILLNPNENIEDLKIVSNSITDNILNNCLLQLMFRHLKQLYTKIKYSKDFITEWKKFIEHTTGEIQIVQKRDSLAFLGLDCFLKKIELIQRQVK